MNFKLERKFRENATMLRFEQNKGGSKKFNYFFFEGGGVLKKTLKLV